MILNMANQYESNASLIVAVTMSFLGLSFIVVTLRFVSRGLILKRISADDWLILLAWVCGYYLLNSRVYDVLWLISELYRYFLSGSFSPCI